MQIFVWVGVSILVTFLVTGFVARSLGLARPHDGPRGHEPSAAEAMGGPALLAVAAVVLWLVTGVLAHRFSRPLRELVGVAEQIGHGNLSSRALLALHARGEVGALAQAINDMAVRIERQMSDQKELLATVSHEVRTPLAHLALLLGLAREQGATPALLDEIQRELDELEDLAGGLLARARVDFRKLERTPVRLTDLVERALARAGAGGVSVADELAEPVVSVDVTLVARALNNLLTNAQRHGGGATVVRLSDEGDHVTLAVEDRGPGFTADALAHAFEPFRGRSVGSGGLGLGLSLVRRIAEAHGGSAFARNLPEAGAEVGLRLLRAPTDA